MLQRAKGHFYKQYKMMARNPSDLAWVLLYPFIGILSLGFLSWYLISIGAQTESIGYVLLGVVGWNLFSVSQRAITYAVTYDMWDGCIKHTFITSSTINDFILGNSLFGFATSLVSLGVMAVSSYYIFGIDILASWPMLLAAVLCIFIFASSVGLIIDSFIITKGHLWMSLIWSTTGITMIFSGVYYPISFLPLWGQAIAFALPTTHAFNTMRTGSLSELAVSFALALIYFVASYLIFKFAIKKTKETGTITWY